MTIEEDKYANNITQHGQTEPIYSMKDVYQMIHAGIQNKIASWNPLPTMRHPTKTSPHKPHHHTPLTPYQAQIYKNCAS